MQIVRSRLALLITLSSIRTKKCNEPIKLLNDLLHPRHSSQSRVKLCPQFWIFSKNRWLSNPATFILRLSSAPGGGGEDLAPGIFYWKFINCLLKKCEIWKKGQFKHWKPLRYLRRDNYRNCSECKKKKKKCSKRKKLLEIREVGKTLPTYLWKALST